MLRFDEFKIGFALEGNGDYPILPVLTRRLLKSEFPQLSLASDSILRPRKRGHGFINELPTFATQLRLDGCDLLVAVVDSDNTRASERLNLLKAAKTKCEVRNIALCIAEGVAVHAVEAWLLADGEALHAVFGGERALCEHHSPETIDEPKTHLNTLVRQLSEGVEVSFASYSEDIANKVRLNLLRRRCPHFDVLAQNILNCARTLQVRT